MTAAMTALGSCEGTGTRSTLWPASPKNFAADWDEERVCVRERARDNDEEIAGEVISNSFFYPSFDNERAGGKGGCTELGMQLGQSH